jgi:hypothetical protein
MDTRLDRLSEALHYCRISSEKDNGIIGVIA